MSILELWMNGSLPADTEIAGLKLFWWARIGKMAQLLAILLMILELVGKARVLAWTNTKADSLKMKARKCKKFGSKVYNFLGSTRQALGGRSLEDHHALPAREKYIETSIVQCIILGFFMLIVAIFLFEWFAGYPISLWINFIFDDFFEKDIFYIIGVTIGTFTSLYYLLIALAFLPILVLYLLVHITFAGTVIVASFFSIITTAMKTTFSNRAFLTLEIAVIVVAVLGFIPDLASS
ncbi:hypothetical protein HGE68_04695 [Rhodobacteraceae bacterium R_SAG6]|nr:hypothetical protein [Rhodobacteraceae bacterium G21628-S1]NKX29173.1 hypothetical protein [Rhodobacteraceae bacterium R_SAG6]